jgi:hypothetical protein
MNSCAVFTIVRNENTFFPLWLKYYSKHFDAKDIYVLDHQSDDGSTDDFNGKYNKILVNNSVHFDHEWLLNTVKNQQKTLLQNYNYVLFAEADEFIVADPEKYPGGLHEYVNSVNVDVVNCDGYDVIHNFFEGESDIDLTTSIIGSQRNFWVKIPCPKPKPARTNAPPYDKPLLSRIPLPWVQGFHNLSGEYDKRFRNLDTSLKLFHLHRFDINTMIQRSNNRLKMNLSTDGLNLYETSEKARMWIESHQSLIQRIPEQFKDVF